MGNFLESSGPRLSGGWFSFWAAVLLILPNCSLIVSGSDPGPGNNLVPGSPPHSDVIFCDIALERRCARSTDLFMGVRLKSAGVALVAGQSGMNIGLDDAPAKVFLCDGVPEAVEHHGPFPEGSFVCVNYEETIPGTFVDADAVCRARCYDLFTTTTSDGAIVPQNPPSPGTIAYCAANARASTNYRFDERYENACTTAGRLSEDFADPRRSPDPLGWAILNGVSAAGGILTRTAPTTGFTDAGASTGALITGGDAYFEFTAAETTTARIAGLSSGPPPPGGITFNDIGFGILLFFNGDGNPEIHVLENGTSAGTFGAYSAGDKFRVTLRDNQDLDGTATVSYVRITGPCTDGSACNETIFHTSTNRATYPVRVDAMFREQGGTVTAARVAYIQH